MLTLAEILGVHWETTWQKAFRKRQQAFYEWFFGKPPVPPRISTNQGDGDNPHSRLVAQILGPGRKIAGQVQEKGQPPCTP